jgi:hypothetical protein
MSDGGSKMKKIPILFVLILIVGVLATTAFTVPVQVHNGIVVGFSQGKSMTLREYGDTLVDYNLTSNTKVIAPSDISGNLDAGARVTVLASRMKTMQTDGWIVLAIIVRQPATANNSSPSQAPAQAPTQQAPAPTPTP